MENTSGLYGKRTCICGEHLLSMRHLLRKTNGYSHTIIKHTKRSRTYGEHLLRILSLLRRTQAVQLITVIIVQISHPTEAIVTCRGFESWRTPPEMRHVYQHMYKYHHITHRTVMTCGEHLLRCGIDTSIYIFYNTINSP